MRRIAVVGGGISGLAAVRRLRVELGEQAEITLVEQADRLGGKVLTTELAGVPYDLGAEAFLARRPEVPQLAGNLGLAERIVHPGGASATIRAGGRITALPKRTVMGVPAAAETVSEVLSPAGVTRVRDEAASGPVRLGADVSVGELLRQRMGDEVVDRLVEPLLGGVYAGDANRLGLRATIPALATALGEGASSLSAAVASVLPPVVAPDAPPRPVFGAFQGGYRELIEGVLRTGRPVVRCGQPVRGLSRTASGWRLEIGPAPRPEFLDADAVVLAVPPPAASRLLAGLAPVAAERFASIELASMAVVGLAFPPGTAFPQASGVLIARGERHADGTPFTAKAFTFSDRKWPHVLGADGEVLVRGSVGRFGETQSLRRDDDTLLSGVLADLAALTGVAVPPVESRVVRWGGGLPQYGVGHLDLVADIERSVAELPGLAVAGAALHGVGVPACVATGEAAATEITRHLLAS